MKKLFPYLAVFLGIALIAAVSATSTKYFTVNHRAELIDWPLDTTTNAGNDTLNIVDVQASNWYGLLHVDGKQLSGTQGIVVIVQRSAFPAPDSDQWDEETRDTLNGSLEQLQIDLGRMEAFRYRIIMDGYQATQSTEWEAALNLKKD
jgi:hypothetical protein